jgi:hypothetical protein
MAPGGSLQESFLRNFRCRLPGMVLGKPLMKGKHMKEQIEEQKVPNTQASPKGSAGQENVDLTEKRFNIQLKKGEQMFIFSVPDGTPYGTAYDACLEILIALKDMINKSVESFQNQPKEIVTEVVDQQN